MAISAIFRVRDLIGLCPRIKGNQGRILESIGGTHKSMVSQGSEHGANIGSMNVPRSAEFSENTRKYAKIPVYGSRGRLGVAWYLHILHTDFGLCPRGGPASCLVFLHLTG